MDSESSIARKGLCEAVQIRLGRWEIHEYTYSSQVKKCLRWSLHGILWILEEALKC